MSCCSGKQTAFPILQAPNVKKTIFDGWQAYRPLIVMISAVTLGAAVLSFGTGIHCMPIFMGLFLLNFAMFKFFDLDGFAKSFAMYDIIGKRSAFYAKLYPFIELALAIGFLSHRAPFAVNLLTAVVMAVGLIGIVRNRLSGTQTRCACMGSLIDVPVGSITILENTVMILMALSQLVLMP